jgi:recombination protein RecA
MGELVAHIDAEHAMDKRYATSLGVDINSLLYSAPKTLEEAETYVMELAGKVGLIVIDSVCAVAAEKELRGIEKDGIEKDSMMVIAANLSKFFRVVTSILGPSKTSVILVNQSRIGLKNQVAIETFSGGYALAHANSVSLAMRQGPKEDHPLAEDGKTLLGRNTIIKTDKNKVGGAQQGDISNFNLWFAAPHIRPVDEMIKAALGNGTVKKEGRTYSFDGKELGVGEAVAYKAIADDPKLQEKIIKVLGGS